MKAPDDVKRLVDNFTANIDEYKSIKYKEAELRKEFLDPFWRTLGWDMSNAAGLPRRLKDVIHEYALKDQESTKAPDYCFRARGKRKFFLEAKKPSIDIKGSINPAFQLRHYAWTVKLSVSILSDFEELAVYDCRMSPKETDAPAVARINYITYQEYIDRWEEIHELFSRERVYQGILDKYAVDESKKKGVESVDEAFLSDIEGWRDVLARNIAIRNANLNTEELNFSVQRIIDRIIFLRICEGRGIEPHGRLQVASQTNNIYSNLMELFHSADNRYNSGIFHFSCEKGECELPDEITPGLVVDDKPLKDIITHLYRPYNRYAYNGIPADILGQVYEQFLGKVIRLQPSHRAIVDDKPEVKKAGGVFYTPSYIVEYLVEHTLGKLLESMTIAEMKKRPLRTVDISCGSGSVLIQAYQYLLDWYLDQYVKEGAEKYAKGKNAVIADSDDGWKLMIAERKRILLDHIFGVDIDIQAVEVTKLSLLLKVLEGETDETIGSEISLFHERALPDLGNNIKWGNSIIGTDVDQDGDVQKDMFTGGMKDKENFFDWTTEFPFKFNVVIGNPPYVRQETLGGFKTYLENHYQCYHGVADLYVYFIEKAINLLAPGGYFSYIVANKWMRANYGEPLRKWLKGKDIEEIIDFGDLPVFTRATTYPCIIRVCNSGSPRASFRAVKMDTLDFPDLTEYVDQRVYTIDRASLDDAGWSLVNETSQKLIDKITAVGAPLGEYAHGIMYRGVLTGLNEAFVIDKATRDKLIAEDKASAELIKPFLAGRDIKRYQELTSDKFLIFARRGIDIKKYPAVEAHLLQYKEQLTPRPKTYKGSNWKGRKPGSYKWYEIQDSIDYYKEIEKPKIIYPDISQSPNFTLDAEGKYYSVNTTYFIANDDKYLVGLLNSLLLYYVCKNMFSTYRGGYLRYFGQYLNPLPIRTIDFNDPADKARHDKMVALVEQMLTLNKKLAATKLGHEKTALQRQIDATDKQIDALVYELYGLTDEEIKIVEET